MQRILEKGINVFSVTGSTQLLILSIYTAPLSLSTSRQKVSKLPFKIWLNKYEGGYTPGACRSQTAKDRI